MIEVARIQRAIEDPKIGRRFRDRVFTDREIDYCEKKKRGKFQSYAGRFAAKEAMMKALGTGWGSRVNWLEIEVLPDSAGKPEVYLHHKTSSFAQQLGVRHVSLSITHIPQYAMAYAMIQTADVI